uniref:Uncharacterized protein n=1 Tax=Anopheles maculatus TaxID=74869 RepID=A0A182SWX1_9DIPT
MVLQCSLSSLVLRLVMFCGIAMKHGATSFLCWKFLPRKTRGWGSPISCPPRLTKSTSEYSVPLLNYSPVADGRKSGQRYLFGNRFPRNKLHFVLTHASTKEDEDALIKAVSPKRGFPGEFM